MKHGRGSQALRLTALLGACAALLACTATTEIRRPCCYTGDVTLARLADVHLVLDDGTRMPFETAFPGFEPEKGFFTTTFPDPRIDIARVSYASLVPVLPLYDANEDGWLQYPELTVLIIREAALGMGHAVAHVAVDSRVSALSTSAADFGGLMQYVKRNESSMNETARQIFTDLERVGQDWMLRGSESDNDVWIF